MIRAVFQRLVRMVERWRCSKLIKGVLLID
jgi:hypothetical protein